MIKAVHFDLDGTLVNSLPFYVKAYAETYSYFGLNLSKEQVVANMPRKTADICKELKLSNEEFNKVYMKNIYRLFVDVKPFTDIVDFMTQLRAKVKSISIVSFAYREYVTWTLNRHGIGSLFDYVVTFEDVKEPKPAPEAVLKACACFKVRPEETLIVGDTKSDMLMGKAASAKTCLFVPQDNVEIYGKKYYESIEADYRITNLNELLEFIV